MKESRNKTIYIKLVILWVAILLFGSFWLTVRETSDPVAITAVPHAPKLGDPVIATFKLNNPSLQPVVTTYQFYANGELVKEGISTIAPDSSKTYQYAYKNPLQLGEQLNFVVRTQSENGNYEKAVSSPLYQPQIWSSFVSFASFSTSVMSSMSSMTYYEGTFGADLGANVGVIVSLVLLALLIFLELAQVAVGVKTVRLANLSIRLSTLTWIMVIIFLGMVYTKIVMIMSV